MILEQCEKITVREYIRDLLYPFYALETQSELTDIQNSCLSFPLIFLLITLHLFCSVQDEICVYYNAFCGLIPRLLELVNAL